MISVLCFTLLIKVVAGLGAVTAPALASLSAHACVLPVAGTWLAFLASPWTALSFTLMAVAEFVSDLQPSTPSRTAPVHLTGRLASGGFVGAAAGTGTGSS